MAFRCVNRIFKYRFSVFSTSIDHIGQNVSIEYTAQKIEQEYFITMHTTFLFEFSPQMKILTYQ